MVDESELTKQERKTLKLVSKGKNMTDAVQEAYNTTRKSAYTISARLRKRKRFLRYLDKQGLTNDLIVKTLVDGMKAEKIEYDKLGNKHTQPHYMARIASADRAIKLRGLSIEDQEKENETNTPLVVRSIKFELADHKVTFDKQPESDYIEGETIDNTEDNG